MSGIHSANRRNESRKFLSNVDVWFTIVAAHRFWWPDVRYFASPTSDVYRSSNNNSLSRWENFDFKSFKWIENWFDLKSIWLSQWHNWWSCSIKQDAICWNRLRHGSTNYDTYWRKPSRLVQIKDSWKMLMREIASFSLHWNKFFVPSRSSQWRSRCKELIIYGSLQQTMWTRERRKHISLICLMWVRSVLCVLGRAIRWVDKLFFPSPLVRFSFGTRR